MPFLQYKCPKCGKKFDELVKSYLDEVNCPDCNEKAERDYSGEMFYQYYVPAWVTVASFVLAVAVTAYAAYKPIKRLSRLSVINSLKADVSINVSLTEGIYEKIMSGAFGRIGRLAGQNFQNNAPRYRAVSFTLPAGVLWESYWIS